MIDPGFLVYTAIALSISLGLIIKVAPKYGQTNVLVYIVICSLLGSFSVACVKGEPLLWFHWNIMVFSGVGLVIKQFFSTDAENPFKVPLTYFLIACLVMSGTQLLHALTGQRTSSGSTDRWTVRNKKITEKVTTQINYLNKSLDIFNTSIVTPIYYVIFTTSGNQKSQFY